MLNINDIDPSQIVQAPAETSNIHDIDPSRIATPEDLLQAQYGTIPQQALTVAEGLGQGALGPIPSAIEEATGLTTGKDIRARQEANPIESGAAQATGFVGSMFVPGLDAVGLAANVGRAGNLAVHVLPELPKIAELGIKTGAEMAALSTSDELSKMVTNDPNQTLGTAAVNIGLSGLIGGSGGVVLGGVGSLFSGAKKLAVEKLLTDSKGQTQVLNYPSMSPEQLLNATQDELKQHMAATQQMVTQIELNRVNAGLQQAAIGAAEETADKVEQNAKDAEVQDKLEKLAPKIAELEVQQDLSDKAAVKSYLSATDKLSDKIATIYDNAGMEVPNTFKLNPTPLLDGYLGINTPGATLARWMKEKGADALAGIVGESAATSLGTGLGSLVGHPLIGAAVGENRLASYLTSVAKPFTEQAVDSIAGKATIDYLKNVVDGQRILSDSVNSLIKGTGQILTKDLIPTQESRNKLEKSLAAYEDPGNALKVGGHLGHYLPRHAVQASETAATAVNYFNSIRPKTGTVVAPLDKAAPVDRAAVARYNRALDIAQQPLMVLKYTKDGTLLPSDVKTLNTLYPGLHAAIVNKIGTAMIEHKDLKIPYAQRVAMNMLLGGTPLDSTMTAHNMQAVMASAGTQQAQQQQHTKQKGSSGKLSGSTLTQMNKVNNLYSTPLEARTIDRRS